MKKKLEMHLLNDDRLNEVFGGTTPCSSGDILYKKCLGTIKHITVVTCITYEVGCRSGFIFSCQESKFSAYCSSGNYIKPKE